MRMMLIFLAAASLLWWQPNTPAADAAPSQLSTTVTLLENTPIYSEPNPANHPIAALSSQNAQIIGAEAGWLSNDKDTDKIWFQVQTWLGAQWLQLELKQLGRVLETDVSLWLSKETPLSSSPAQEQSTGLSLASQTVHAVAHYKSKLHTSYLVETWAGPLWIHSKENDVFPVTPSNDSLTLPTFTSAFKHPNPYEDELGILEPQHVTILDMYREDWRRIRTASREEVWVHSKYAEPRGALPVEETVELPSTTPLRKYPEVYDSSLGALAPQKVKAHAKWESPAGEPWYRIDSWQGSAWIRVPSAAALLTKEAALKLAQQQDSSESAVWNVEFISALHDVESGENRPVWKVTALYPAGNRMVVTMDAITGKMVSLMESEPEGR
jgi:hypothetical protein